MASEAQIRANRKNSKKGGRKKGVATLEAEAAKNYIAEHLRTYMPEIFSKMLDRALEGDINHIKELFDRAWGKSRQNVGLDGGEDGKQLIIQLSEVIAKKNGVQQG